MQFHVPRNCLWKPYHLVSNLVELGFDAESQGACVVVRLDRCEYIGFPRIWEVSTYTPRVYIHYASERPVYNGRVNFELFKHPTDAAESAIEAVLLEQGYKLIGEDIDLELAFLQGICPETTTVRGCYDELRRLAAAKAAAVARVDFETVAHIAREQDAIRHRIEVLTSRQL